MSGTSPISIALVGFEGKEQQVMHSLFRHAEHWQQPWRTVSEGETAQIMLLPADSHEELTRWRQWSHEWPRTRLIAYARQAPENAHWHLTRRPNDMRPSPLEFAVLLKRIVLLMQAGRLDEEDAPCEPKAAAPASDPAHVRQKEDRVQRSLLQFFKSLFQQELH